MPKDLTLAERGHRVRKNMDELKNAMILPVSSMTWGTIAFLAQNIAEDARRIERTLFEFEAQEK